jgi:8-amino-7-oxononanoate synthase
MTQSHDWIQKELSRLQQQDLLRRRKTRQSPPVAGMVQIDDRQFINFGSNDYLGLAASEELVLAVQNSVSQLGVGSGASQLVNGRGTLHRRLEEELARFEGTESALLFPSGYAANIGVITSLVGDGDVIYSDALNHASIIDGCRLSGARTVVYRHCDVDQLAELMKESNQFRRRLIVTDGLFSMDGDIAPLVQLCDIAEENDSMIVVDEAHATGVFGTNGRGCCELLGVENRVTAKIGTLSKSIGSIGGFVAASQVVSDFIFNRARSQVYSTAVPEINAAASLAGLRIIQREPERRISLLERAELLRNKLQDSGRDTGKSVSQIIPIIVGASQDVVDLSEKMAEAGLYIPAIRPPSVPSNQARLRISLSSQHTEKHIEKLHNFLVSQ